MYDEDDVLVTESKSPNLYDEKVTWKQRRASDMIKHSVDYDSDTFQELFYDVFKKENLDANKFILETEIIKKPHSS